MREAFICSPTVCVALLGALIVASVQGGEEERILPARPDNAAINYLLAAARLERPKSEGEVKGIEFVEGDFQKLPPAALRQTPGTDLFLEREADELGPMFNMHVGAGKPLCRFDVEWEAGPNAVLPHLGVMRNLARHAIAVAKYHEFSGQPEKAAVIYADLTRMAAHMAEEPMFISGLVAVAVNGMNVHAAEGFLAANPPPEAIRQLRAGLARVPDRSFPIDRWLLVDGKIFGDWFEKHPEGYEGLTLKDRANKEELLREYRENVRKLADLAREPYFKSGEAVNAMWARTWEHITETVDDPAKDNPLMREVFLPLEGAQLRCSLGEAYLRMLRILVAAALYKTETGAYPDTLDKLDKYFSNGLPKDPFTGKSFIYRLKEGLPRIESDAPQAARSAKLYKAEWALLDLGLRRQKDAEALKAFQEKYPMKWEPVKP